MDYLNKILLLLILGGLFSCGNNPGKQEEITNTPRKISIDSVKKALSGEGYQVFDYKDEKNDTTYLMQQYFIVFLKKGSDRTTDKEKTDSLMPLHLAHLGRMYEEGYASISGPFGDDGDIRGITIYNTPTLEMADSLARLDPMVKSGRLMVETHPWWAAKGLPLR